MQFVICESDYSDLPVQDVPELPFQAAKLPLYIGVKEQQVNRMKNKIDREKLGGNSIGFWELLSKKGTIKWDMLRDHDMVFICAPDRCHELFRGEYSRLVDTLVNL